MQNLSFDNGFKTFSINNDDSKTITINTSDVGIVDRLNKVQGELEQLQSKIAKTNNNIAVISEVDNEIKAKIDYIFGAEISKTVFGSACCLSLANGKPIFENFLNAIIPIIKEDTEKEIEKMNADIEKYSDTIEAFK